MQRPIVLPNPANDAEFVEFVTERTYEVESAAELQRVLRERYPDALVRLRSIEGEQHTVWYVYRDGRWTLT